MLTKDRIADIENVVTVRLRTRNQDDTPKNRLTVLHELRDEWLAEVLVPEDFDRWLIAIEIMISKADYAFHNRI